MHRDGGLHLSGLTKSGSPWDLIGNKLFSLKKQMVLAGPSDHRQLRLILKVATGKKFGEGVVGSWSKEADPGSVCWDLG